MLKGRCECAAIRLTVNARIEDLSHCHCSQCRRLHGAAFATFACVRRSALRFERGEHLVSRYQSSARNIRMFCSLCGSNLLVDPQDEPGVVYLSMSILEGDPPAPLAYHSYVGSKAPWYEITDDLEQFDEDPPEEGK